MDYGLLAVKTDSMDRTMGGIIFARFNQMFRNTLCNNLDTYNNLQLSKGKPRIHVTSIDSREKIELDYIGRPIDPDVDPDAMLTLFFQMAGDCRVVVLGNPRPLHNNAEVQRCLRKAAEHEARVLNDSITKINDKHLYTIKGLKEERELLKAEVAALKADAGADVGQKRARTEDGDLLVKMHKMMEGSLTEMRASLTAALQEKSRLDPGEPAIAELQKANDSLRASLAEAETENGSKREHIRSLDRDLREVRTALKTAEEDRGNLQAKLRQARALRDQAEAKANGLDDDNKSKTEKYNELQDKAKATATNLGLGTRVWAKFLELDMTGHPEAQALQKSMEDTVRKVNNHCYLKLQKVHKMLPWKQPQIEAFWHRRDAATEDDGEQ